MRIDSSKRSMVVLMVFLIINSCFYSVSQANDLILGSEIDSIDGKYQYLLEPLIGKIVKIELNDNQIIKGELVEVENNCLMVKVKGNVCKINIMKIKRLDYIGKRHGGGITHKVLKGVYWSSVIFIGVIFLYVIVYSIMRDGNVD